MTDSVVSGIIQDCFKNDYQSIIVLLLVPIARLLLVGVYRIILLLRMRFSIIQGLRSEAEMDM